MLAGHLAATREALRRLGWDDLLALLPENATPGLEATAISRRGYLAWLRDIADSRERVRAGNHFYGKVHLLLYGQVSVQRWSHLILTGLNEGVWPRLAEGDAFGSRHGLAELNAAARILNRAGEIQGGQGEGHESTAPGHGHCLLPLERHGLALRDLCRALRATSHGLCLAARTQDQGQSLLPSDFFSHAWQIKTGQVLDEAMFRDLAEKSRRRCREHAALFPSVPSDPQAIEKTKIAFDARRDPTTPFGRYEFAFATTPEAPIQLSCKEWESALAHPAEVWLAKVVGVGPWPEGRLNWNLSLGTWAHRWLSGVVKAAPPSPPIRCAGAAERLIDRDRKAVLEARGREAARHRSITRGGRMSVEPGRRGLALSLRRKPWRLNWPTSLVFSEFDLPCRARAVALTDGECSLTLRSFRGRIDLLLAEATCAGVSPASFEPRRGCDCLCDRFQDRHRAARFRPYGKKAFRRRAPCPDRALRFGPARVEALGAASTIANAPLSRAGKPKRAGDAVAKAARGWSSFFRSLEANASRWPLRPVGLGSSGHMVYGQGYADRRCGSVPRARAAMRSGSWSSGARPEERRKKESRRERFPSTEDESATAVSTRGARPQRLHGRLQPGLGKTRGHRRSGIVAAGPGRSGRGGRAAVAAGGGDLLGCGGAGDAAARAGRAGPAGRSICRLRVLRGIPAALFSARSTAIACGCWSRFGHSSRPGRRR